MDNLKKGFANAHNNALNLIRDQRSLVECSICLKTLLLTPKASQEAHTSIYHKEKGSFHEKGN